MLERQEIEEIRATATDPGGVAATSSAEEILKSINHLGLDEEAENATVVLTAYHLLENVQGQHKGVRLSS